VRPDSAQLLVRHLLPGGAAVPRESAEFVLASWVRAGRAVTGVPWRPVDVRFAHRPTAAAAGELARFFGCPIHFSTGVNALVVAAATAALPTLRADAGLLRILDRHAGDLLERVPRSASVGDRIRHLLHGTLRTGVPTTAQLAARLHVSPRTLERSLRAEGTNYKALLNGLRMELASEHLLTGTRSIGEIAFLLGFSEASAFHRAFRRWSGSTPAAFRSRVLAQPVSA
jgi:AraC-like DNA-binding protein